MKVFPEVFLFSQKLKIENEILPLRSSPKHLNTVA